MILELAESRLPAHWKTALRDPLGSPSLCNLDLILEQEISEGRTFYPYPENIFRALETTDLEQVKVVLLGQDPYHGPGQAIGLSFAVPNGLRSKPPSLKNLLLELKSDLGIEPPDGHSDLTGWADQGVLLLNTLLTVREGEPLSHAGIGWEAFTSAILRSLQERESGLVFLLLGSHAQRLVPAIAIPPHHRIITAPHPSPLSAYRGFFGSRIYSRTNEALKELGHDPIDWSRIVLK